MWKLAFVLAAALSLGDFTITRQSVADETLEVEVSFKLLGATENQSFWVSCWVEDSRGVAQESDVKQVQWLGPNETGKVSFSFGLPIRKPPSVDIAVFWDPEPWNEVTNAELLRLHKAHRAGKRLKARGAVLVLENRARARMDYEHQSMDLRITKRVGFDLRNSKATLSWGKKNAKTAAAMGLEGPPFSGYDRQIAQLHELLTLQGPSNSSHRKQIWRPEFLLADARYRLETQDGLHAIDFRGAEGLWREPLLRLLEYSRSSRLDVLYLFCESGSAQKQLHVLPVNKSAESPPAAQARAEIVPNREYEWIAGRIEKLQLVKSDQSTVIVELPVSQQGTGFNNLAVPISGLGQILNHPEQFRVKLVSSEIPALSEIITIQHRHPTSEHFSLGLLPDVEFDLGSRSNVRPQQIFVSTSQKPRTLDRTVPWFEPSKRYPLTKENLPRVALAALTGHKLDVQAPDRPSYAILPLVVDGRIQIDLSRIPSEVVRFEILGENRPAAFWTISCLGKSARCNDSGNALLHELEDCLRDAKPSDEVRFLPPPDQYYLDAIPVTRDQIRVDRKRPNQIQTRAKTVVIDGDVAKEVAPEVVFVVRKPGNSEQRIRVAGGSERMVSVLEQDGKPRTVKDVKLDLQTIESILPIGVYGFLPVNPRNGDIGSKLSRAFEDPQAWKDVFTKSASGLDIFDESPDGKTYELLVEVQGKTLKPVIIPQSRLSPNFFGRSLSREEYSAISEGQVRILANGRDVTGVGSHAFYWNSMQREEGEERSDLPFHIHVVFGQERRSNVGATWESAKVCCALAFGGELPKGSRTAVSFYSVSNFQKSGKCSKVGSFVFVADGTKDQAVNDLYAKIRGVSLSDSVLGVGTIPHPVDSIVKELLRNGSASTNDCVIYLSDTSHNQGFGIHEHANADSTVERFVEVKGTQRGLGPENEKELENVLRKIVRQCISNQ